MPNRNALIQGREPLVLERMGRDWAERAQMITAIVAKALPWVDDNVVAYIAALTVGKEYVSKRARIYWSYLRPVRLPWPDQRVKVENVGLTTTPQMGNQLVDYNPSIRGPLGRTFQIPGMLIDSDFARFRHPVLWLEYKVRTTLLVLRGSLNRPDLAAGPMNGTSAMIVQKIENFFQPPYRSSSTYGLNEFYEQDEAYWQDWADKGWPYLQNASHPYPRRWWGPGSIFLEPGRLR